MTALEMCPEKCHDVELYHRIPTMYCKMGNDAVARTRVAER